jgi:hypothetical protein
MGVLCVVCILRAFGFMLSILFEFCHVDFEGWSPQDAGCLFEVEDWGSISPVTLDDSVQR